MRIANSIAGAAILLLSFGAAQAQTPHWQTYAPPNAGFIIQMPDPPKLKKEQKNGHERYSALVAYDKSVAGADLVFLVKYQLSDSEPGPGAASILDSVVKAMTEGGKLLSKEDEKLGGFPAVAFSYRDADKDTFLVRAVITDKAFIQALYLGPLDNALGKKFIDSFAVSE